jgi:hypothetical protein
MPIDIEFVGNTFELPGSIEVSPKHDGILDRTTWAMIEGSNARRS